MALIVVLIASHSWRWAAGQATEYSSVCYAPPYVAPGDAERLACDPL